MSWKITMQHVVYYILCKARIPQVKLHGFFFCKTNCQWPSGWKHCARKQRLVLPPLLFARDCKNLLHHCQVQIFITHNKVADKKKLQSLIIEELFNDDSYKNIKGTCQQLIDCWQWPRFCTCATVTVQQTWGGRRSWTYAETVVLWQIFVSKLHCRYTFHHQDDLHVCN